MDKSQRWLESIQERADKGGMSILLKRLQKNLEKQPTAIEMMKEKVFGKEVKLQTRLPDNKCDEEWQAKTSKPTRKVC